MIKAISMWSLDGGLTNSISVAKALEAAAQGGFDGLELCIAEEGMVHVALSPQECDALSRQMDSSSVHVSTLASGMSWGSNPVSDDPAVRARALSLHKAALERAAWLGLEALLFVPGVVRSPSCPGENVRYDRAVRRARSAVEELLEVAHRMKVDLLIENVWNGLFYSPLELAAFIDSFDDERLGIYFDVGNVLGYHQDPALWIEILGSRIRRVHIKDFKSSIGTLEGFCDLLEGDVPFESVMAALRGIGYEKTVTAEMIPWSSGLLERTSVAMDRILAMGEERHD